MKYNITISGGIGCWPNIGRYVRDEVSQFAGKPITVYVNSRGGSAEDALEIYQAFRDHGDVTVYIFGFTASAATVLAMGAKKVIMSSNALFLIHKASQWLDFWGSMNAEEISAAIRQLERHKDTLNKLDSIITNIYATRACGDKEVFGKKMETAAWLTAEEVKNLGLIDEILEDNETTNAMTDDIRNEILDAQLPLPESSQLQPDPRPSFGERVKAVLQQIGLIDAAQEQPEPQKHQIIPIMNKKYTHINAALGIEGLNCSEQEEATINADQLAALDNALADANDRVAAAESETAKLRDQLKDLQEEIQNLKNGDGDSSGKSEGEDDMGGDAFGSPSNAYNEIKKYL